MRKTTRSTTTTRRTGREIRRRRIRRRRRNQRICFIILAVLIIAVILGVLFHRFTNTHFDKGTTINGVDCSWLTPENSYNKLNEALGEKDISFVLYDEECSFTGKNFDLQIDSISALEKILQNQKNVDKGLNYTISTLSVNPNKLLDCMKSISSLNEENMTCSRNAYVCLSEDNLLTIVPEIIGNYINFDEAYEKAYSELKNGSTKINLSDLEVEEPTITSAGFEDTVRSINAILSTSITFNLPDGSTMTLDRSVMKDWLVVDESGNYSIDIDSNLPDFIDQLAQKVKGSTVYFEFEASNLGAVSVPVKNVSLNKDAEMELIKSELGTGTAHPHTPIYNLSLGGTYVEIDIARQHVWLYKDGVCIMDTDCVTGNKGNHDTHEGFFFLTSKETDRILRGYNDNGTKYASHVDFWMPFDGGIGLHDASWRSAFGGNIYLTNGSHGCVNLPRSAAEKIYNTIDYSTPIIVYYSSK